jgi:hypothetical protein
VAKASKRKMKVQGSGRKILQLQELLLNPERTLFSRYRMMLVMDPVSARHGMRHRSTPPAKLK